MLGANGSGRVVAIALMLVMSSAARAADDDRWSIGKSSGDVWVASPGAEQVLLNQEISLKPGDTIRTGPNGRVLLARGEETMMIAPNSVVGLPTDNKDGMATTVLQQAGSILLDVAKRNVKHFEVETPYLAAVVKGTQFRVTVNATDTKVEVSRGQVEVSAFKSGQIAQILSGQTATAFAHGYTGLKLSGSGKFAPIEQGRPRASSIDRVLVPRGGLQSPSTKGTSVRALAPFDASAGTRAMAKPVVQEAASGPVRRLGVVRISAPLGEVKLDVAKATHGLAHGVAGSGSKLAAGSSGDKRDDSNALTSGATPASAISGANLGRGGGISATAQSGGSGATLAGIGGGSGGIVGSTVSTFPSVTGAATSGGDGKGDSNNGLHLGWGRGGGSSGGSGNDNSNGNSNGHGNGGGWFSRWWR
jgi:hypothetical protein